MVKISVTEKFKNMEFCSEEMYGKYPVLILRFENENHEPEEQEIAIFNITEKNFNDMKEFFNKHEISNNRFYCSTDVCECKKTERKIDERIKERFKERKLKTERGVQ